MDALQREVARQVEDAARRKEDPATTFQRVRALAQASAGRAPAPVVPTRLAERRRPPRLSEAWFC
jgi:hypothetical protein